MFAIIYAEIANRGDVIIDQKWFPGARCSGLTTSLPIERLQNENNNLFTRVFTIRVRIFAYCHWVFAKNRNASVFLQKSLFNVM